MPKRCLLITAVCLSLGLVACGSDQDPDNPAGSGQSAAAEGHSDVQVIRDWSDTLSEGDVEGAAEFFAVPSTVSNGTPPIELSSREDVIDFNRTLPCGAELVRAEPDGAEIDATFRLKERPGGDCGPGVGGLAGTAFEIEDGKITEWRRLDDLGGGRTEPSGPIV